MVSHEPAKLGTFGSCAFESRTLRQMSASQIRLAGPDCKPVRVFDPSEFKSRGTHQSSTGHTKP